MGHSNQNVDSRIHAFIAGKTHKTLSDTLADLIMVKFGGRDASAQSHEAVIGMHYNLLPRRGKA